MVSFGGCELGGDVEIEVEREGSLAWLSVLVCWATDLCLPNPRFVKTGHASQRLRLFLAPKPWVMSSVKTFKNPSSNPLNQNQSNQ